MSILKTTLVVGACLLAVNGGSSWAGWPMGLGGAYARRFVGPAIRQANPYAYSGLLAAQRSIPPQVRNNWNKSINPYRGGGSPRNAELNYWRSLPPEVRNNMDRQYRLQMGYAAPTPQVIYVPNVPSAAPAPPVPGFAAGALAPSAIPAPPPPSELPRIIRPN